MDIAVSHAVTAGKVRYALDTVTDMAQAGRPDMGRVARIMAGLAEDAELWAPVIASLPADQTAVQWLHRPDAGPNLVMLHRPAGHMSGVHSHHTWVCLAPIVGAETHQRYEVSRHAYGHADIRMSSSELLTPGHTAWITPPHDVHSHGHLAGTGDHPFTLIMLGDNMLRYSRWEYTLPGSWRVLPPGNPGIRDRALTAQGT